MLSVRSKRFSFLFLLIHYFSQLILIDLTSEIYTEKNNEINEDIEK